MRQLWVWRERQLYYLCVITPATKTQEYKREVICRLPSEFAPEIPSYTMARVELVSSRSKPMV
jgi:hypothetical protein